jgi:PAS domain S-box-containing protein
MSESADVERTHGEGAHLHLVASPPTDEEILLNTPLAAILDALPDAVFLYAADGRIIRANHSARELFALDAMPGFAALPAAERFALIAPRDLEGRPIPPTRWHVDRLLQGETIPSENPMEARIRGLDGQERIFSFSGTPIRAAGRIVGAIIALREISERLRHDEENAQLLLGERAGRDEAEVALADLRRKDAQLRQQTTILDRTHDAIFIWEMGGAITYWNRGAELLYGYTPEQAIGRLSHDLLQTIHPMTADAFEALLAQDGEWTGELEHTTSDGRAVAVLSRHQLLRDVDGKQYVLETSRDITERKQMERELAERAAELEAANRQMDMFLSVVGHELRMPLATIKPNLQLAERNIQGLAARLEASAPEVGEPDALERLRTLVGRALRQANRMTRLVNDLTDASRIQSDRMELELARCDLAAIVRECVEEQRQSAAGHAIQLNLPKTSVPLQADALRIGQVVANYLTNALRYTPPGQPITVTVRTKDGQARVAVRDQGLGIAQEEQARIWQRFHRVPGVQRQSESGVGLGLGLFISKSLIERHGGEVGVESRPGQGATFWFTLPIMRAES